MRNGRKNMIKLKCKTIEQYYVLEWIQKNFQEDHLALKLAANNTILLNDGNDYAYISFNNNEITIAYSERYDFKTEKVYIKKPYR